MNEQKKARPSSLAAQIEVTRTAGPSQGSDTLDPFLGDYLGSFLAELSGIPKQPEISLLTPESARAALTQLHQTQEILQQRLKTARALKRLLNEQ